MEAGSWYAESVAYVSSNGLMNGTSAATFSPTGTMTRGMLATVLYRAAGSPSLENENLGYPFADVPGDSWYSNAVYWARLEGLMEGYGGDLFGPGDPVTREQIAAILWRYAGSPTVGASLDYADEDAIASWAADAVDWARTSGVIDGREGNRFAPQADATRAEVAVILHRYLTLGSQEDPDDPDTGNGRVLVVYFSATGNTEAVAGYIAQATGGDLFEITPAAPYTSDDLDWTDPDSRVNAEHEDPSLQNVELTTATPESWDDYDTVFIGYPIWWGIAAWPVSSFAAANDFSGKTAIPFCTSSSSGLGESGSLLAQAAGTGTWLEGMRFRSGASQADVEAWVDGLNL